MPSHPPEVARSRKWKGDARASSPPSGVPGPSKLPRTTRLAPRDEGKGGAEGIVLSLNFIGDGIQESIYTLPLTIGPSEQEMQVQVDTGSSDLWLASTSCSDPLCAKSKLYNPSAAMQTGQSFDINYLAGHASGPIYWDDVVVGGYSITNQALAAIDSVSSEQLSSDFNGILGLALPSNSIIEQLLPATISNNPDGAIFSSNLFGITPVSDAPAARFISVALQRPGMDAVPSVLGIGRHPSEVVSDPSKITYSEIVRTNAGEFFWESSVRDITVYVNGTAHEITLGRSTSGAVFPTAVLDTGVPYILSSTAIANGIYGALGIGPASDGQYYVPCNTPINMTITLDGQPAQSIHPLDLTAVPSANPNSDDCIGLIQTDGGALDHGGAQPLPDMVLGVTYLRNAYMVMAFDEPNTDGSFPNGTGQDARPHLGLMSLTNITQALEEFNTVRVLGQPLASSHGGNIPVGDSSSGISVGIKVMIGLLSFIGLCALLFGAFFIFMRRRWRRRSDPDIDGAARADGVEFSEYRDMSRDGHGDRTKIGSSYTADSGLTRVGDYDEFGGKKYDGKDSEADGEGGFLNLDPGAEGGWRTTIVGDGAHSIVGYDPPTVTYEPYEAVATSDSAAEQRTHGRTSSSATHPSSGSDDERRHSGDAAVAEPLLAHTRDASRSLGLEDAEADALALELGEQPAGLRSSMAGVGTAARGSRISVDGPGSRGSGHAHRASSFSQGSLLDDGRMSPVNARFPVMTPPVAPARDTSPVRPKARRSVSPRPGSASPISGRLGAMPLSDVPASDFEFLNRRSHAFVLQDPLLSGPGTGSRKRGRP